jgi:phosphatidate phosphatase APP1
MVTVACAFGRREIRVLPFIGYGTPQRVRVRGRVVLGRPAVRPVTADLPTADRTAPAPPGSRSSAGGPVAARRATREWAAGRGLSGRLVVGRRWAVVRGRWGSARERWSIFRDAVAPFLTMELPGSPVSVRGPGGAEDRRVQRGRCDRQGYLDVAVDVGGLAAGWHELTVTASWRGRSAEAAAPVLVVDPEATLAVVSDLDDTVIETGITRGLEFLRLTLLTEVTERAPLPGAAELYRALTAGRDGRRAVPVFYLSTSPWNLYELLSRFLVLRGFPVGPLLLTDWGPSRTNLFRVPTEVHKLTLTRALLAENPTLRVVLIGDTGQLDPEIYATLAQEAPERVLAVYVRRTAGMSAARAVELHGLARRVSSCGVPMLVVEDSAQIAVHAAGLGLLGRSDVEAVRRATQVGAG